MVVFELVILLADIKEMVGGVVSAVVSATVLITSLENPLSFPDVSYAVTAK